MRARAVWCDHDRARDLVIWSDGPKGKSTALLALIAKFESCVSSSSWGSDDLWKLKPLHAPTASHVRMTKPVDTLMWYPLMRLGACPGDIPSSVWYMNSMLEEIKVSKQCVVVIDDADLFGSTMECLIKIQDACKDGGSQMIVTARYKPPSDGNWQLHEMVD